MTMKKRIISLILVVVMSVLTLASCAYSYTGDDMTKYATFDKAGFLAALAEFEIEDGDFTENAETRAQKVLDNIMSALAKKVNADDKKTEGTIGTNDIIYYCYYVTATIGDKPYTFYTEKMKESAVGNVQLGLSDYSTDFAEKVAEAFKDFEFTADSAYKQVTEGNVTAGQVIYLTYTRTYEVTDAEGKVESKTDTAKSDRIVLDPDIALHAYLIEKAEIGKKIDTYKPTDDGKDTYTNITIDWAESGEGKTITDVTYDEDKNETPTFYTGTATKQNLKDVELTYHVYPVSYSEVADITVESIINDLYGKSITLANLATILFGKDYSEHEHKEDEEDDTAHKLLEKYKFTVEGEEISLEDFVTKLVSAQTKVADNKTAMDAAKKDFDKKTEAVETAEKTVTEKTTALEAAKAAYEAEATDANKTAFDNATKALEDANKKLAAAKDDLAESTKAYLGAEATETEKAEEGAKKKYEDSVADRDALVTELTATVEGGADAIVNGYKNNVIYRDLEKSYNADIKTKIATYVYDQIIKFVKVNSYPKKAVKAAYKYLIDSYEYCFYENYKLDGTSNSSATQSYYKQFGGSFKQFLIQHVAKNEYGAEVKTYEEAVALVQKDAEAHVGELIAINLVAQTLDLTLSKKEFKELTKDDYTYDYYKDTYYDDSFETMYQFDKLMDELVKSEEKEDGLATLIVYKNDYIGTVKLVEKLTEKTETE